MSVQTRKMQEMAEFENLRAETSGYAHEFMERRKVLLTPPSAHACCLEWLRASAGLVKFYKSCDGDYDREAFLAKFRILAVEEVLQSSLLFSGRLAGSFLPFICTELNTFIGEFRPSMSDNASIVEIDPEGDLAIEWAESIDVFMDAVAFGVVSVIGPESDKRVALESMPRRQVMRRGLLRGNSERFDGVLAGCKSVEVSIFNIFVIGKYKWEPHAD